MIEMSFRNIRTSFYEMYMIFLPVTISALPGEASDVFSHATLAGICHGTPGMEAALAAARAKTAL
jgi:hypothetical protein